MISAQTRSAFVARENRYTLFRIVLSIVCLRYFAGATAALVGTTASAVLVVVGFAACGPVSPSAVLTKRSCICLGAASATGTGISVRGNTSATASVVTR